MREHSRDDDNRIETSDSSPAPLSEIPAGHATWRGYLQVSPIATYLTDEAGVLIFYNELAADILGA